MPGSKPSANTSSRALQQLAHQHTRPDGMAGQLHPGCGTSLSRHMRARDIPWRAHEASKRERTGDGEDSSTLQGTSGRAPPSIESRKPNVNISLCDFVLVEPRAGSVAAAFGRNTYFPRTNF